MNKSLKAASVGCLFLLVGMMIPLVLAQRQNPGKPEVEAALANGVAGIRNVLTYRASVSL